MLKFLENRLTEWDQILYTDALKISKTKKLQLHCSDVSESHMVSYNFQNFDHFEWYFVVLFVAMVIMYSSKEALYLWNAQTTDKLTLLLKNIRGVINAKIS